MIEYKLLDFKVRGDHDGKLVALEKGEEFPFDIQRVFYIWDTAADVVRGKHSHKTCQQVIICSRGSCDFTIDNGSERITLHLNDPARGLYLKPNIWGEFTNFSQDCMVLVLASEHYDESDYIRDYDTFLQSVQNTTL